jgi:hypothetical protein
VDASAAPSYDAIRVDAACSHWVKAAIFGRLHGCLPLATGGVVHSCRKLTILPWPCKRNFRCQ